MRDAAKKAAQAPSGKKLGSEELRSAYRSWLKDLHDDEPAKLLRKLDQKKANDGNGAVGRRLRWRRRQQQAQQPTAASVLKDAARRKDERAKLPALVPLRLTPEAKEALMDAKRRRHQALVQEATFAATQYPYQPEWLPGLAFFQQLVDHVIQEQIASGEALHSSSGLRTHELTNFPVHLVPILVRVRVGVGVPGLHKQQRGGDGVALFFCQEQEQSARVVAGSHVARDDTSLALHIHVYSSSSVWSEHREALLHKICGSSDEIRAVWKQADDLESRSNALHFLRSREDVLAALDKLWPAEINGEEVTGTASRLLCAIQQFIPCKGTGNTLSESNSTRRAWIARCFFRKRDRNASTVWIISGGSDGDSNNSTAALITSSNSADCQFVKCSGGQAWSEPRFVASTCALALGNTLSVTFNELVVDLLQDDAGGWWMLQIKAFELSRPRPSTATRTGRVLTGASDLSRSQSAPTHLENAVLAVPMWKKWRCAGRFCVDRTASQTSAGHHNGDPVGNDKEPCGYLTKKVLRSCEFYQDFVKQQDYRLPKRDRSQLYEPQPLCNACVCRYHALRQEWMQTVAPPKAVLPGSFAGSSFSKRLVRARNHVASADQLPSAQRKLPALQSATAALPSIKTSISSPMLPGVNSAGSVLHRSGNSSSTDKLEKRPSYLDDLAAMEQMLAQHEPQSVQSDSKTTHSSPYSQQHDASVTDLPMALSPSSEKYTDIFQGRDGQRRIEDMWQSLALQPLGALDGGRSNNSDENGSSKHTYNSFSLQREIAKLSGASTGSSSTENQNTSLQGTGPEATHIEKGKSTRAVRFDPEKAQRIRIQHCRRVFEDEVYREQIVDDAVDAVRSGKCGACLVVVPPEPTPANTASGKRCQEEVEQQSELAEMALRSLYLDVKQALGSSLDPSQEPTGALSISSWPLRPDIFREASGCVTMTLGPT